MITFYKSPMRNLKIAYKNGRLLSIEILKPISQEQWERACEMIPMDEADLQRFQEIKRLTANEKIALWCEMWKEWTLSQASSELEPDEVAYKVNSKEAGMVKGYEFSEDLIYSFFTHDFWTKEKTIANYIKHFNEIRFITARGGKRAGKGSGKSQGNGSTLGEAFYNRYGNGQGST